MVPFTGRRAEETALYIPLSATLSLGGASGLGLP